MSEYQHQFTLEELAEQVNIPIRTIRYYITEGLLPGSGARGKAATYGEEHLLKLSLVRLLSSQHMPLVEMRQLLNRLSLAEIRALLREEDQRTKELGSQQPKEFIATLLKNAQAARQYSMGEQLSAEPYVSRKKQSTVRETAYTGDSWQRWEVTPGVELHIKASEEQQNRDIIKRIFNAIGIPYTRHFNES